MSSSEAQKSGGPFGAGHSLPSTAKFRLFKGAGYRTIHSNGAWFRTDPQNRLSLSFYHDSFQLPEAFTIPVDTSGKLAGVPDPQHGPVGFIDREIEVNVLMSLDDAVAFHTALGQNIESIKKQK